MERAIPNLQVRVHKLDGSISTFAQDDAEKSKAFLDAFQPMEIFGRDKLFLADVSSYTVICVPQITRVDFYSEEHNHLIFESGLVEAVELSKTEFESLIQNVVRGDQWKHLGEEDAFVVAFLNVEMADGQSVLLTMEVDAESPQSLYELRDFLLGRPGLCFRMRNGGVAVLNLANLTRLTLFPGTSELSDDAWNVRLQDTLVPGHPAETPTAESSAPEMAPLRRQKLALQKRA